MHIGFVVYGDVTTRTGGFRYDRRLAAALRDQGNTVEFVELPWRRYLAGLLAGAAGRPVRRVVQAVGGSVDALLQDELAHPSLVGCTGRVRNRVDAPVVAVVHHLKSSEPNRTPVASIYRAVERRYLHGIDGAICTSGATRRAVRALASPPCVVAPPAGDRFDPDIDDEVITHRAREEPLRLVHVGAVVPRKGVDILLEAVARVEGCELTVVGSLTTDRGYAARVTGQARRLDIADRVTFTGEISDDDLAAILRRSHALAMPSHHEGFGIAYLDGMGFGLPAIATTAGGADEVVTDGETGVLVPPGDAAAVAEAVHGLAADRARLARMGRAAGSRFEQQPDWADAAATVSTFLRQRVGDETDD